MYKRQPHGLHDDDHYTTARDLVRIAQAALKSETFKQITNTATYITVSYTHLALDGADVDRAEVARDELAHDGKPESRAARLPRARLIHAVKALKNVPQRLMRDARAGVLHGDRHVVVRPAELHMDAEMCIRDSLCHLADLVLVAGLDERDEIAHLLLVNILALGGQRQQRLKRPRALIRRLLVTLNFQLRAAVRDVHAELRFDALDVLVKRPEYVDQAFHTFGIDGLFNHSQFRP